MWPLSTSKPAETESEDAGIKISGAIIEGDIPSIRGVGELPPAVFQIDNFDHDEIIPAEVWDTGPPKIRAFQYEVVECVHKYEVEAVRFDVREDQFIDDQGVLQNYPYLLAVPQNTAPGIAMAEFLKSNALERLGMSAGTRNDTFYKDLADRIKTPTRSGYYDAYRIVVIEQLTKSELMDLPDLLRCIDEGINSLSLAKFAADQTEWEIELYRRQREEMALDSQTKKIIAPIKYYKRRCTLCGKRDKKRDL